MSLSQLSLIKAEKTAFVVEEIQSDGTTTRIDEASSYTALKASYDSDVATANNIQIRQGKEVWKLKYGVVLFATSETCDCNVTYLTDQGNGYSNGCYGIDAAYTGSSTPGYKKFPYQNVFARIASLSVGTNVFHKNENDLCIFIHHETKACYNNDIA